jgi:hypothetical protein
LWRRSRRIFFLKAIGALNNRGSFGNYWSSTENGSNAYNLNPANNNNRTNGFSVRCIAALNTKCCFNFELLFTE